MLDCNMTVCVSLSVPRLESVVTKIFHCSRYYRRYGEWLALHRVLAGILRIIIYTCMLGTNVVSSSGVVVTTHALERIKCREYP